MGLFNFLKPHPALEKQLLDLYVQTFVSAGIPLSESKRTVKTILDRCIEESKKEGSYLLPQNMGDILLGEKEVGNPRVEQIAVAIRENLPKKRDEGVRDTDIRWWWNLHDIERRMMIATDDIFKTVMASDAINKGLTTGRVVEKVRKYHPMYGDPGDTTHTKGEDRPLPFELKDRINLYTERRARENPEQYKKDVEAASSFNALIRGEIRAGGL